MGLIFLKLKKGKADCCYLYLFNVVNAILYIVNNKRGVAIAAPRCAF